MFDAVATVLATSIHTKDIDVPSALRPSTRQSGYHERFTTAPIADKLFLAGSEPIDVLDEVCQTPLLVSYIILKELRACTDFHIIDQSTFRFSIEW